MKKYFFISFCFLFLSGYSAQNLFIDSYDIKVKLIERAEFINVTTVTQFHASLNITETDFVFSSKANLKNVEYSSGLEWQIVNCTQKENDSLNIVFPQELPADSSYKIKLEYYFPADIKNDTLLLIDRGHRWYPMIPDQIAPFKITCGVPDGYEVLSAGDLISIEKINDVDYYTWQSVVPVFKIPLAIFNKGVFYKTELSNQTTAFQLFTLTDDSVSCSKILSETEKAFNYFYNTLGYYPYKKLVLLEVNLWEGMNIGSGIISVGSRSLGMMKEGYLDGLNLTIAEQWIGAGVFAHYGQPGFWFFALSLPHYLRLMYLREIKGEDIFQKEMNQPLEKYKEFAGKENDVSIIDADMPNSMEKSLVLYAKGPYVFYKLNETIGNEKWISFLGNLYSRFRGKVLDYELFVNLLTKYDEDGNAVKLLNKLVNEKGL